MATRIRASSWPWVMATTCPLKAEPGRRLARTWARWYMCGGRTSLIVCAAGPGRVLPEMCNIGRYLSVSEMSASVEVEHHLHSVTRHLRRPPLSAPVKTWSSSQLQQRMCAMSIMNEPPTRDFVTACEKRNAIPISAQNSVWSLPPTHKSERIRIGPRTRRASRMKLLELLIAGLSFPISPIAAQLLDYPTQLPRTARRQRI